MRTKSKTVVLRLTTQAALVVLFLGAGRAGHGEVIAPARRDVVKAERRLESARGRISVTAEHLSATQSLRTARLGVLRACQAAHDAVERVRKEAEKAEALARTEAAEAEQFARDATMALDRSRELMKPARARFLNQPLLAYDFAQHGTLTLNALTGAFDLSLDDGAGIKLAASDLDALLAGQFQLPDIDPLHLAPYAAAKHERLASNYAEVQANLAAEYGAANVYLLSRRFLDWATPERIAGDFAGACLVSGRSVVGELADARRQLQLEYEDLAVWLRLKGVKDLGPDPTAVLVELVRTGSYPRLGLSVKTRQVEYTHRLESNGRTEVPVDYLARLRPKDLANRRPAREMTELRPAVAIIWAGPSRGHESIVSQLDNDFRLSPPTINDLPKLLPIKTDTRIRHLLGDTAQRGLLEIDAATKPRRMARAAIGLRKEDIESSAVSNRRTIDLRASDLGEIVALFLSQLALGNQKSCDVDVLQLDRFNGRLEAEFTLHHRHAYPSLREAQAQLRATLGPVGTDVEDLADRLPDAAFDAARKVYHEADIRAHEAGKQAYEAEQRAHEAIDRVVTKGQELATLASELGRAQTEFRTAAEREALASQEAQTACVHMLELDAQVRLARNRANALSAPAPAKPLIYGSRDAGRKW